VSRSAAGGAGLSQYDQLVSQHHFQQQQAQLRSGLNQESGAKDGSQKSIQSFSDRFGLLGLLSVIRMSDLDLTTLALGTDLTTLGLNLNSRENLYKTFASPWADGPVRGEPEFTLPACYVQPAPRLQVRLSVKILKNIDKVSVSLESSWDGGRYSSLCVGRGPIKRNGACCQ
jgi:CCR4-NOT transcription complex subunit 2